MYPLDSRTTDVDTHVQSRAERWLKCETERQTSQEQREGNERRGGRERTFGRSETPHEVTAKSTHIHNIQRNTTPAGHCSLHSPPSLRPPCISVSRHILLYSHST